MNRSHLIAGITITIMLFVFTLSHAQEWNELTRIIASDGLDFDEFGGTVSISGDYAVIGARRDDDIASDCGSAYIFKRQDTDWLQQEKLSASDGASGDYFGYSVSISGNFAIVGSKNDEDSGFHAGTSFVFKMEDSNWTEHMKLLPDEVASSDSFGCAVAISGNNLIVGARGDDGNGMNSGAAYMFEEYSPEIFADGFESGDLSAWQGSR